MPFSIIKILTEFYYLKCKNGNLKQIEQYTYVSTVLERLKQEDCHKSEASLGSRDLFSQ